MLRRIPRRIAEVLLVRESTLVALLENGGAVGNCKSAIETSRVCIDEVFALSVDLATEMEILPVVKGSTCGC